MANFRITPDAGAWWPVRFNQGIDGGHVEEVAFDLKFRRMTSSEAAKVIKETDADFVLAVATAWRGVTGNDGPVAFDRTQVALAVDLPGVAEAIGRAWAAFISATPETRLGNFEPSLAGGPAAAAETVDQTGMKPA